MSPPQLTSAGRQTDTHRHSFGERVEIVNQLLGGRVLHDDVCRRMSISREELERWVASHARDRPVSLDEFRRAPVLAPDIRRLVSHLRQLESLLRARQRELVLLKQIAKSRGLL